MKHLLKYYTALQPLFRERMGNPMIKDDVFDGKGWGVIVGVSKYDLSVLMYGRDKIYYFPVDKNELIMVPRTIDDSSEEAQRRSLWGMCEGLTTVGRQLFKQKSHFVTVRCVDENGNYEKFISFKGATPTEAILKALCTQGGIEV